MINESFYHLTFHQEKVIYYLSYPERIIITIMLVLFWYFLCVVIKREIKKEIEKDEKGRKNFLWRLIK